MPNVLGVNIPEFPLTYSKKEKEKKNGFSFNSDSAKRIYSIAQDFLKLNPVLGPAIDYGSQGVKIFQDVQKLLGKEPENQKETPTLVSNDTFNQLLSISQTVGMLSLSLMNSRIANIAQTTLSAASSGYDVYKSAFHEQDVKKTLESLAKCVGSLLSLGVQFYGGVELTVASMLMRACLTIYSALDDYLKNNGEIRLEAIAKIALACIQIKDMQPHVNELRRKYQVIRKPEFSFLLNHIRMAGKQDKKGPLKDLRGLLQKKMGLVKDGIDLGTHVANMGGGLVKGGNLCFRERNIDGKLITELEFKLNAPQREAIQPLINQLCKIPQSDLKEFLHYSGMSEAGVCIREVPYEYLAKKGDSYSHLGGLSVGNCYEIALPGVGSLMIGREKEVVSLYDRVVVRMNGAKQTQDLKGLLSLVGLEKAVVASSQEDIERLKVATLFEAYHPKESTELSKKMEFYTLPIEDLKAKISFQNPDMKGRFQTELKTMKTVETLPGRLHYTVEELGKQAKAMGAVSVIMGVGGSNDRIISMLRSGALSSQVRFDAGMIVQGASSVQDHYTGGADEVFTRIVTRKACDDHIPISSIPFSGNVLVDFDAERLLKWGGAYYQHSDTYGTKKGEEYLYRPDLLSFVKQENNWFNVSQEGMFPYAIPAEFMSGCTVPTQWQKDKLVNDIITAVKTGKLDCPDTTLDASGNVLINKVPIQKFIKVGTHLSRKLFDKTVMP